MKIFGIIYLELIFFSASKDRASILQAKINQRMATLNLPGIAKAPVLDKEGRTLDASGKAISVIKHEPTLKV